MLAKACPIPVIFKIAIEMSISLAAVLLTAVLGAEPAPVKPVRPIESPADLTPAGKIDELVFARLKKLGLQPSPLCSDAVFVRRVHLNVIGTLPTAAEARDYLLDRNPDKRRVLIDRLLQRDELADYWAMKWSDLLRIKAEFPINLWPNAAQAYYHWIRTSIRENKPYDRFARELLTSSGSNFRVPPVNFYRAIQSRQPTAIAQAVALALMGARAEKWPKERLAGMSVFFAKIGYKPTAEWKEEIVFFDPTIDARTLVVPALVGIAADIPPKGGTTNCGYARRRSFPDGTAARIPPDRDPREVFADWLIDAKNPWFARNIVNRTWCWLDGRGIIPEPDDIRPENPPSNPELLAYLEHELVASHYDLKHIYRLILNSKTYQLSSLSRGEQAGGRGELRLLSPSPPGGRGLDRRHLPGHRHDGEVFQRDSGAVHVPAGRASLDRPARREHYQPVPGRIRPAAARHGPGVGAEQPRQRGAAAAHVEFDAHSAETGARPADPGVAGGRAETAAIGGDLVPDHPLPLPHG